MKTEQIMLRELMGFSIRQNHKTQMFNANDLHKLGNDHRKLNGYTPKQMAQYFKLDSTSDLIKEICLTDVLKVEEVKKSTRSKDGGTWVHPILFVDLAMWYSPKLKVQIIKWVIDGLLDARDNSGESYKRMTGALLTNFPDEFSNPLSYSKVAKSIAAACGVGTCKDKWQKATEDQLKLRDKIQENIELIADMCANSGECLSKAIEKAR